MASERIEISSELGFHHPAPVRFRAKGGVPEGPLELREGAPALPVQRDGEALVVIVASMKPGEKRAFHLESAKSAPAGVSLRPEGEHTLAIALPEGPLATYVADPKIPRPFFYPVLGPGGKMVTRNYPMKDVEGEQRDHPHHRSFWTAYGEVNDVDDWSEEVKPDHHHGYIRHQKFVSQTEGPVFGGFVATAIWTSADDKPVLDDRRTLRVYNVGSDRRLLDYDLELIANHGDVHYGDTKEAGLLAFRVATTMDGARGGLMENSSGGKTEKEVWGKRANWLDYSGPVDGETFGIGMMDHPGNPNHPCYWHARDYGLVGTNPFARAAFNDGPADGYHQKAGTTLRFRYRVLLHRGGATEARVNDAYHAWVQPPAVG